MTLFKFNHRSDYSHGKNRVYNVEYYPHGSSRMRILAAAVDKKKRLNNRTTYQLLQMSG